MNILSAFDRLDTINESGVGGQRTYKQFLLYLAEFLGCIKPANYRDSWVLHHRDCNHSNNSQFENLVLMNPLHHISLHAQLRTNYDTDAWDFLEIGTTENGEYFEYWTIGEAIASRINKVQTEPDISQIAS